MRAQNHTLVLWSAPTALFLALGAQARVADAQVMEVRPVTPLASAPEVEVLRGLQEGFESFRRSKLPSWRPPDGGHGCDETIGRFCYWYDERQDQPPPEPEVIREARIRLIAQLDSAGRAFPSERWVSGQRVRYLAESERYEEAVAAARACVARDWWCGALRGFTLHVAGRYAEADSEYRHAMLLMDSRASCDWKDLKLMLDDALLRRYRELNCATRFQLEERVWWLSRPMLSAPGNDARTEYYSRLMMSLFLEDAPSVYRIAYDKDERELLLRYGWPRAWTRDGSTPTPMGAQPGIIGFEPSPAHPLFPPRGVLDNPATSDSVGWRSKGIPPVRARYSPAYAKRLVPLEHQAALFRRGDTALVAVAWSVAGDTALAAGAAKGELTSAMVLTKGDEKDATIVRGSTPTAGTRGSLTALASWGSMLMSVEVAAPARKTLARARYGVRGSDMPGSRVQMSDIALYDPYDGLPMTLEDVLPHMRTSERIPVGTRIGVYWEAYNTNPAGEGIAVSITVAPENAEGGWLRRRLTSLRLTREAKPVTVGMQDMSARGASVSPRAVVVDLSTLTAGRYLMQLQIDAGGGNVVRAERAITVVAGTK